ncbi:hypothetical protein EVAR_28016_1 [Eumeta japonica]|uniref:Uncharacterized protein n=1 Tax=Eumeta variegata TaxID=151549 RepID=A0A4C1WCK4_EUMVA|nr:hypothetical protein EVAR_28016_1 [Eumeta japonica]
MEHILVTSSVVLAFLKLKDRAHLAYFQVLRRQQHNIRSKLIIRFSSGMERNKMQSNVDGKKRERASFLQMQKDMSDSLWMQKGWVKVLRYMWRRTTHVRNIKTVLERTTAHPRKLRLKNRTLHRIRHRLATAFFRRRVNARVRPPAAASAGRLMKQNVGRDI